MSNGKTFEQQWGSLQISKHNSKQLPENFRIGRPKFECLFFSGDNELVSCRVAMQLTSKKTGKAYHVCAREEATSPRTTLRRAITP